MHPTDSSRRYFIRNASMASAAIALPSSFAISAKQQKAKMGVALVGLGNYSDKYLGPALKECDNAYLAGIVTGSPEKIEPWRKEYNIPEANVYNYDNYDDIANNDAIDIIYIVLPNSMHAEFSIRALEAGKHVICEKPMALNESEARKMIATAKRVKRKLAIGYRMHYDPYFIEAKRIGQKKLLGNVNFMECSLAYRSAPPKGSWKTKIAMGGGPLYNLGVYPIQSARHTKGVEPISLGASASTMRKDLFPEVFEHVAWTMEFSDGSLANCFTGATGPSNRLYAACDNGFITLDNATAMTGQIGSSSLGNMEYPQVFQQKFQIEDFVKCIQNDTESIVNGYDGMQDIKVIDAIYASLKKNGATVKIG